MPGQRLVRSTSDRMIGGVCGGLAAHFGVDPGLVRVVWLAAVVFGGFGLLLYGILWVVLPPGDTSDSGSDGAIRIAEERFARGEIDAQELKRLRDDLGR